jgi:Na+-driven multidrug efflux pump
VLRVGLNFLLIPNGRFHLYGSAVATAVSFLFLSVYCLVLMRRITKVKFSRTEVFAKPVLAVIFSCLTVKGVAGVFFTQLQNIWNFVLSAVLFSAVLTILLLLFGTLSTKDLHFAGER